MIKLKSSFYCRWTRYNSTSRLLLSTVNCSPPAAANNKQILVDAEGNTVADLKFIEEPLGLTQEQTYGYPRIVVGDLLGQNARYEILRKLGWGLNSSVWLARDRSSIENKFVSVKVLKGYATEIVNRGISRELTVLQLLSTAQAPAAWPSRCLSLLDHFIMPGKVSTDGEHLCIVTDLMGGDVKSLVRGLPRGKRYVPLPLAKRILRHVLEGLVQIHSLGVAHTDLKHDNIMFDVDPSLDIPSLLARNPPRLNIPEQTWEDTMQTAVSQPLPPPSSLDDLHTRNFFIADFGSAQIVEPDERTTDHITPCALRAPETILLGPWNQRVDIWAFGCLVFELITGHNLFEYVPYPDRGLDAAAGHLWQMICFTGEEFEPKQLRWSQRATQYFERTTCYLKENPPRFIYPFETPLRKYKVISEEDVLVTATFMRRCLRLDPDDRPSAEQLLDDPFWAERSV